MSLVTNSIKKVNDGYSVIIPFELKDEFKAAFPNAKWDKDSKRWVVSEKAYEALLKVTAELDVVAAQSKANKELDLDIQKLDDLIARINARKQELVDVNKQLELQKVSNDELLKAEQELLEVEKEVAKAKDDLETVKQQNTDIISKIIDINEVQSAFAKMKALHNVEGKKKEFNNLKDIVEKARDALWEAGFESKGLDYICDANYFRPDRDNLNKAPDILIVTYVGE